MGTYQVVHKYTLLGQEIRNVFYYVTSVGEPSDSEWQDIADEIRADWVAEMRSFVVDDYTIYGIDYRRVDIAGLLTFSKSFTAGSSSGSDTADPLPTQIAMLVSNKGTTTKPNRARSYLAGFGDSDVSAGLFLANHMAAAEAFIDLQSNLNSAGTNPLSRVSAQWNTGRTQVIATNDISGASSVASQVPATQRRRRIGVGI
jgi:hypothetical protein